MPTLEELIFDAYKKAKALSPAQAGEGLYGLLNKPMGSRGLIPTGPFGLGDGLPSVPHQAGFRPMPEVVGGKRLQNGVDEIMHLAPELQGQIKRFHVTPGLGEVDDMVHSKINPTDYPNTTLLGQTMMKDNDIYINPNLEDDPDRLTGTIAHESAHAMGGDEATARLAKALLDRMRENRVERTSGGKRFEPSNAYGNSPYADNSPIDLSAMPGWKGGR